jgi:hypothetical protein
MSASDIQAKVKAGLAKAKAAVGSSTDGLVYLVRTTQTGTPLAPATTEALTLLPNAIFKSYDKGLADVTILTGDRQLVSDSDNEVVQGDTIRQGTTNYIVVSADKRSPTGSPLVYISQVRQQ